MRSAARVVDLDAGVDRVARLARDRRGRSVVAEVRRTDVAEASAKSRLSEDGPVVLDLSTKSPLALMLAVLLCKPR